MKKMFTLFVSLVMVSVLFAQYKGGNDNRGFDDHNYQPNDSRSNHNDGGWNHHQQQPGNDNRNNRNFNDLRANQGGPDYRPDHAIDMRRDDNRWQPQSRINDNDRRMEINRLNRDYDRQIDVYRNDRGMNPYDRDRRIDRLRNEKATRLKNLGAGVLVGGLLGVIIGSQL